MSKVYVKFPKSGLGNLMLVWAKARLFAELNNLPLVIAPWWGIRLGAWARNEKRKRLYMGYFKESNAAERMQAKLFALTAVTVKDPPVQKIDDAGKNSRVLYVFNKISTSNDIFSDLREHRDFIKQEIYKLLQPTLLSQLHNHQKPVIAIHIRRGDFKIANPVTPLSFFIDCIQAVRKATGHEWPVTVFTDADEDEINEVLLLPNVHMAGNKPDILDILLMSMSKVVVLSKSSTFSYWGAFLSDAIVLRPFDDWQKNIRGNNAQGQSLEILWKVGDPACLQQLNSAFDIVQPNGCSPL